jgi:orotate phosphoribosyltransferase
MEHKKELIAMLKQCGALRFGKFKLTSGKESNYYIDIKHAITQPAILSRIADMMTAHIGEEKLIAGMELGAVPIATALALKTQRPFLIIRKESKAHGTMKQIEGTYQAGDTVFLVEDVCTTAGSMIKSIEILRQHGCSISRAIVVVDREEGGREALAHMNVELLALLTSSELLGA